MARRYRSQSASVWAVCGSLVFVSFSAGCVGETQPTGSDPGPVQMLGTALLAGTATASSIQSSSYPASNAVDGNFSTRWSSQSSDPQWIQIDFGSAQAIHRVTLYWQHAYGANYQIQVSNDASAWTTVVNVTGGTGGTNDFTGLATSGRYVRMYGTKRGTQYGYSLWEFQVNASGSGSDAGTSGDATADAALDAGADAPLDADAASQCKRGFAYGANQSIADLQALANGGKGLSWWYDWALNPDPAIGSGYTATGVDFVPMQWGGEAADGGGAVFTVNGDLSKIPAAATYLLGFNEPNFKSQANTTPEQAAALWPQMEQIASKHNPPLKLVSPAVNYCGPASSCNATDPIAWLDAFFAACTGCQVDAIAAHWYACYVDPTSAVDGVKSYVGRFKKYNKPVWLTEFAGLGSGCTTTAAAEQNYMAAVVPYLESEPVVARYAWFIGRSSSGSIHDLLSPGAGQLTPLGQQYVSAPQSCGK